MSKNFGKTWWGEQWLNSLAHIDYSNRLPRGSAYARNGKVVKIDITENSIKAKVQGSRPKPYEVTIIIPPFFEGDIKKLIKAIAEKPVIISKLLNRELDPALLTIAENCGLKVFPRQWTDFKMQCSCPDWAVPCKHLAAVIYKVSAEIDNNPFLAFTLHRMDLPAELEKQNIHITDHVDSKIPTLLSLLTDDQKTIKKLPAKKKTAGTDKTDKKTAGTEKHIPGTNDDNVYQKLNFTTLVSLHDPLIQLLADAPVFYQGTGNFRDKYSLQLNKAVHNAQRLLLGKKPVEDFFPLPAAKTGEPIINHHAQLSLLINSQNTTAVKIEGIAKPIPATQAVALLWQLPAAYIQDYQPSAAALKTSLLLSINLVANGAVTPQIILLGNKRYAIRWLPAMISKEVKTLVESFSHILPTNLLFYEEKTKHLLEKDPAVNIVSAWLNVLILQLSEIKEEDIFTRLFFGNFTYSFSQPGEQALPAGIYQWLQRYYFSQGQFKAAIVVEETKDDRFLIAINVTEPDKPLEKPVALQEVLTLKKYDTVRFEILQSLAQLSSFIPGLDNCINTKGTAVIGMDTTQFAPFLMQAIPAIQLLDISILLPKSLQHILKPRPSLRIKRKAEAGSGFIRLDQLLDFDWQVAIGDTVLSEAEFKKLLKRSDGLIKYKTGYIYVNQSDLEKLHKHFTSSKELSAFEMLRAALSNDYFGARISLTTEVKKLIQQLTEQKEVTLPQGLNATLRPYQHRGFSWMYRNTQIGFGSVLADDMGLGKTLQVIATLLKYKEEGLLQKEKALIIVPTGLLSNWQAEMEKFAPSLQFRVFHGAARIFNKKAAVQNKKR